MKSERRHERSPRLAAIGRTAAVLALAGAAAVTVAGQDRTQWTDYNGGPDNAKYSTLTQIDKTNVSRLQVAWTYPYGETTFNPIVARGVAYVRGRGDALVALDAATGKEIWVHDKLGAVSSRGLNDRGINYWESPDGADRRLIFSVDGLLQETDARTGKSIVSFGRDGVVDLREGLGRDPKTIVRVQSRSPGKIFENLLIIGTATGEAYFSPPGDLRAYDVVSGTLVWQFHTVPHPDEYGYDTWPKDAWQYAGGTNTWGEITIDPKYGIAFFPTGSPTFDFYGGDRHGVNLFSDCLLALDARTGKRLWQFQNVHHDLWDYDNTSAPQLTTITRDGRTIDAVAMAGKTGFLYVFDRLTGEPIWPIEERPVPTRTEVPGEQVWPTQPFPTAPPAFAKQSFTADDLNPYLLTDAERAEYRDRISKARNEGLFTPIGFGEAIHMPGNNGGSNWGSTSANPTNGTVYVMSYDVPAIMSLLTPEQAAARQGRGGGAGRGRGAGPAATFPPGPVAQSGPAVVRTGEPSPPDDYPEGTAHPAQRYTMNGYGLHSGIVRPPYMTLTAYDLNRGAIKWQVPLGDDPRLAAKGITGTGTAGTLKFGAINTANGLVFVGAGDDKLHVYDAESGKPLWAFQLGAATRGCPSMFELNGRQYLLMTASGEGVGPNASPRPAEPQGVVAFALPANGS